MTGWGDALDELNGDGDEGGQVKVQPAATPQPQPVEPQPPSPPTRPSTPSVRWEFPHPLPVVPDVPYYRTTLGLCWVDGSLAFSIEAFDHPRGLLYPSLSYQVEILTGDIMERLAAGLAWARKMMDEAEEWTCPAASLHQGILCVESWIEKLPDSTG